MDNNASVMMTTEPKAWLASDAFTEWIFTLLPRADFQVREVLNKSANKLYLVTQGKENYLLKCYQNEARYGEARKRLSKEVFCLENLSPKKMAPALIGYHIHEPVMLMRFVSGTRVGDVVLADNMARVGLALGAWLAQFHGAFESKACRVDALSYYQAKYQQRLKPEFCGSECQARLKEATFTSAVFCKNDSHRQNFIIGQDDHVVGIDFEFARYAPPHFDLADLARSLANKIALPVGRVVDCLLEGYARVPGSLLYQSAERDLVNQLALTHVKYLADKNTGCSKTVCP